jgi:enoyl-CoA hydratase/carnithine racemase
MSAPAATRTPDGQITEERLGPILRIGIDRREKYNGFTPHMLSQLAEAYTRLDEDPALRAGVLFAHGPHFTAGLDLPRFREGMQRGDAARERSRPERVDPVALGRACRKPVVAAVHGITFTLGIELMLGADIVVAADDCRFAQIEPKRGIMATGGATFRFVERGGWGNAMYHLLLMDEFGAAEAYRCGLVQEVVPAGTQLERATELARKIAASAPLAIQATKASARLYAQEGEAACIAAFASTQAKLAATEDAAEGVRSFVERRDPVFTGR